ncbi:peptidase Do [Burkholderia pseudomallei]|nr:peptidase Do [Burkholderia pseudomallei]
MVVLAFVFVSYCPVVRGAEPSAAPYLNAVVQIYADIGTATLAGSGFFISPDGDIATAYHVVQGARALQIVTPIGSFRTYRIKAYDAGKDLAVLTIVPPPGSRPAFLKLSAPPGGLTGRTGFVIGNPDLKRDFAVHVSFPRDGVMLSKEWSAGQRSGVTQFVFANDNVHLVALDGTLNHGMSGGPVVVDGAAIGVFSGGEEESGGGLAWAISAEYLPHLLAAAPNQQAGTLPPLTLLSASSAKLGVQKAVRTAAGSELFSRVLAIDADRGDFGTLARLLTENNKVLEQCGHWYGRLRASEVAQGSDVAIRCLMAPVVQTRLIPSMGELVTRLGTDFKAGFSEASNSLTRRVKLASAADVKQGLFRTISAMDCKDMQFPSLDLSATMKRAAAVERVFDGLPAFPPKGDEPSVPREQLVAQVRTYLSSPAGPKLVQGLIDIGAVMADEARIFEKDLAQPTRCLRAMLNVVDFNADLTKANADVDLNDLQDVEKMWFIGQYLGYYEGIKMVLEFCRRRAPGTSVLADKALLAFEQRQFLLLQRSRDIGRKTVGEAGWKELFGDISVMARQGATALDAQFSHSTGLPASLMCTGMIDAAAAGKDLADETLVIPDAVEVISGESVNRRRPRPFGTIVGSAIQSAIAATQPESQGDPGRTVEMAALFVKVAAPVMTRLFLKQQFDQCEQSTTDLPVADRETLAIMSSTNETALQEAQSRAEAVLRRAGIGGTHFFETLWQNLNKVTYVGTPEMLRSIGITGASNMTGLCSQVVSGAGHDAMNAILALYPVP